MDCSPRQQKLLTKRNNDCKLPLFICDDHCEALQAFYHSIRRRELPFTGITVLHFDAHPDLMVPTNLPADCVWKPHDLFSSLRESDAGIAEWLLPAVYAGHVERIIWVRPLWSEQFKDGASSFLVGKHANDGCLRVSSKSSYFTDDEHYDDLYAPEEELINAKRLFLHVCTIEQLSQLNIHSYKCRPTLKDKSSAPLIIDDKTIPITEAVVLDICLDYFSTANPVLESLKSTLNIKNIFISDYFEDETCISAISNYYSNSLDNNDSQNSLDDNDSQNSLDNSQNNLDNNDSQNNMLVLYICLRWLYLAPEFRRINTNLCHSKQRIDRTIFENTMSKFLIGHLCIDHENFQDDFLQLFSPQNRNIAHKAFKNLFVIYPSLNSLQKKAIQTSRSMWAVPEKKVTIDIQQQIQNVCNFLLQSKLNDSPNKISPKLVTIACSSDDGYTPKQQVAQILDELLKGLSLVYNQSNHSTNAALSKEKIVNKKKNPVHSFLIKMDEQISDEVEILIQKVCKKWNIQKANFGY